MRKATKTAGITAIKYEWEMDLFGASTITVNYKKDNVPNVFTRVMSRILLNCKWRKL